MAEQRRIVVVGAGVVGLTCAVRLAEAGHDVHVLARDLPLETTSAVAAALWYPYRALPYDRVSRWAGVSYQRFVAISREEPEAGVDVRSGVELLTSPAPGPPWWHDAVPQLERLPPGERPAGYADGWRLEVPVVDMSRYLPWLTGRLEALGATITRHWLHALPDGPDAPLVVNCTGIAARALADDRSLHPVRGQVVVVGQVGIRTWTLAQDDPARPTYVVPRRDTVVVGGTAVEGAWDRTPDLALAKELLARATVLEPRLAAADVLAHRVGLRPARPSVRLEAERRHDGGAVVHCYGHGGAGVTLSWGCAEDVAVEVHALVAA